MNDKPNNGHEYRRIAVAFDPAFSLPALLDTAARLAVVLGAELEAIFVEDPDMASLSRLPFGRLFEPLSGTSRPLDEPTLAARRAGPVARHRLALRELSRTHRLVYTVREYYGRDLSAVAQECSAELIVVGSRHSKFVGAVQIDEEAMALAATTPRSVLLVSGLPVAPENVVVIAGADAVGERAVRLAQAISGRPGGGGAAPVTRLSPDTSNGDRLAEQAAVLSPSLVVLGLPDAASIAKICDRLRSERCSILVVR